MYETAHDWRYEIERNPEPDSPSDLYFVTAIEILPADATWPIETDGRILESFTTDDPYAAVEAAREAQAYPDLEERWNMQAEREARERMGGGW